MPVVSGLVATATLDAKDTEIESKILYVTGLLIPSVTTAEFNRLAGICFDAR